MRPQIPRRVPFLTDSIYLLSRDSDSVFIIINVMLTVAPNYNNFIMLHHFQVLFWTLDKFSNKNLILVKNTSTRYPTLLLSGKNRTASTGVFIKRYRLKRVLVCLQFNLKAFLQEGEIYFPREFWTFLGN